MRLGGGHSAIDRKSRVAAARDGLRKALPNWSDPEFETYASRHYPGLLAEGRFAAPDRPCRPARGDGKGGALADDGGLDRCGAWRHRTDGDRARPSAAVVGDRRRLRLGRRQYRRSAYFHHHRRLRARLRYSFRANFSRTPTKSAAAAASPAWSRNRCAARCGCATSCQDRRKRESRQKIFAVEPEVEIDNTFPASTRCCKLPGSTAWGCSTR